MRRADIVDGGFLHQFHVAEDTGLVDDLHRHGIGAVRGHTAQFDGLAVELQDVPVDRQFTETELMLEGLQRPILRRGSGTALL